MTSPPHAAVVLAAGGSTRLGAPKQLLRRDGETLVRRAVRLAAETNPARLLVVVGAHRARIEAELEGFAFEAIDNPRWTTGLASSLDAAAIALAQYEGAVLVLGCDQPALEPRHLAQLLALAARAPSGCSATRHDDDRPGVPAVVAAHVFARARGRTGDRGLGADLGALRDVGIGLLDAPALAFDVDDPADVAAAVARGLLDAG